MLSGVDAAHVFGEVCVKLAFQFIHSVQFWFQNAAVAANAKYHFPVFRIGNGFGFAVLVVEAIGFERYLLVGGLLDGGLGRCGIGHGVSVVVVRTGCEFQSYAVLQTGQEL